MQNNFPLLQVFVTRLKFVLGWLCAAQMAAGADQNQAVWQNSLGMKFVPAGTPGILFSIWDTRVQDYLAFTQATGRVWFRPDTQGTAFKQESDEPAISMSWDDAEAFCRWLTDKERQSHLLQPNQSYRLPLNSEWEAAVGQQKYPWGDAFPPPVTAGNFNRKGDQNGLEAQSQIDGADGYAYTSPAGRFQPNAYGLYDMGGNVFTWGEEWLNNAEIPNQVAARFHIDKSGPSVYRVQLGSSWADGVAEALVANRLSGSAPELTSNVCGFRCVLVWAQPESYPFRVRGSAGLLVNYEDRILVLEFKRGKNPAGNGLDPGEGSWLDRGLRPSEPSILKAEMPEPEAKDIMTYLSEPGHYWTFYCYNTNQGYLRCGRSGRE
jgi:hypothetical protein